MKPDLCEKCGARGIIATRNGPTCEHSTNAGLSWWPAEWPTMLESQRIKWLNENNQTKQTS